MSYTTIQVPADHVAAVRRSLADRRAAAGGTEEVESLLEQIADDSAGPAGPRTLTGPREILWSALYDSLCAAAEQLAEDCNEYWRGVADAESARAGVATVASRLELLLALGAPPTR